MIPLTVLSNTRFKVADTAHFTTLQNANKLINTSVTISCDVGIGNGEVPFLPNSSVVNHFYKTGARKKNPSANWSKMEFTTF